MKILMLTPYVPYPLMSGGQVRTWNLVKRLCHNYDFTLVCFYREEKEKEYKPELKKIFKDIYFIKKDKPWKIKSLLRSLGSFPLLMNLYDKKEAKKIILDLLRNNYFDLIHCEPFYIMQNLPSDDKIPILLIEHNIEYEAYSRFAKKEKIVPIKLLMQVDIFKMKHWEKIFWQKAQGVTAVSQSDADIISDVSGKKVTVIPNGVDIESFSFNSKTPDNLKKILFVGDFKWFPNIEAADILIRKIFPKIKEKLPAKLWIVGKKIPDGIKKWRGNGIEMAEMLPDIRVAYNNSDLLLAPMYSGGGTKYKVLEAMASGCLVVTTPIGAEGLKVENGQHLLIGKNNQELIEKTIMIFNDNNCRLEIIKNARKLIEDNYSWDKISKELDNLYLSINA